VVESLRWIHELVASGRARPEEIAICTTSTFKDMEETESRTPLDRWKR
jgi:hypothetical protein